jgi:hypothetical protein
MPLPVRIPKPPPKAKVPLHYPKTWKQNNRFIRPGLTPSDRNEYRERIITTKKEPLWSRMMGLFNMYICAGRIPVPWSPGPLVQWSPGSMVPWFTGPWVFLYRLRFFFFGWGLVVAFLGWGGVGLCWSLGRVVEGCGMGGWMGGLTVMKCFCVLNPSRE